MMAFQTHQSSFRRNNFRRNGHQPLTIRWNEREKRSNEKTRIFICVFYEVRIILVLDSLKTRENECEFFLYLSVLCNDPKIHVRDLRSFYRIRAKKESSTAKEFQKSSTFSRKSKTQTYFTCFRPFMCTVAINFIHESRTSTAQKHNTPSHFTIYIHQVKLCKRDANEL